MSNSFEHFSLILKVGCFSCSWLGFGPFILEQRLFFIGTVLSSFWPGFPRIRLFPLKLAGIRPVGYLAVQAISVFSLFENYFLILGKKLPEK